MVGAREAGRSVWAWGPALAPRRSASTAPSCSRNRNRVRCAVISGAEIAVRRDAAHRRLGLLNDRERQVAVEVARGRSNAEIAAALHIAVPTVKTHVSAILTRLDLTNRVQVAILVHDAGLSAPDESST